MKTNTIKRVERVEEGRYTYGTNFVKGDFIPTIVSFVAYVIGDAPFEVGRDKILSHFPGRQRITQTMLDSFKGKDANILR